MANLMLRVGIVGLTLNVLCTVRAVPIREQILLHDDQYSVQYGGVMEPAVRYYSAHGFKVMNTIQLRGWLKARIDADNCHETSVLQISDVTPKELVQPWDETSPISRYCALGGRWVAPGGNTFYAFEGADDFIIMGQGPYTADSEKYLTKCFGVHRIYGLRGKGDKLVTAEGLKWGLETDSDKWLKFLQVGVPAEDVTPLVQTAEEAVALLWLKNLNPQYPYSGLVGLCVNLSDNEALLEMVYRLCTFNGEPLAQIPAVDWRKNEVEPNAAVTFKTEVGGIPRRAFQRGETVPLAIHAYGQQFGKQAVTVRLSMDDRVVWEKTWPKAEREFLKVQENVDTAAFRCGEYTLRGIIDDRQVADEKLWICPARRNNEFPFLTCKMTRKNRRREEVALKYLRDHHVNAMIFDLYQLENAPQNPLVAKRLGNYLDLLLRNNLTASARPTAMQLYTENKDEKLMLYDGAPHSHGVNHDAMSWRAFVKGHLDDYRRGLRKQVTLLRGTESPILLPFFTTNDDGSMGGNYDFHPLTMAAFERKTGLNREALPPMRRMEKGNNVFMPQVDSGVVPDDHPWLEYFRFHCGNYNRICEAAMEGVQSGWPGSLVADTGCMSGPLYIPRGYYPPLSFAAYNTASFYQYLFWFHAYPFAIESGRMGNREKPVGIVVSASWIAWGETFQKAMLYRILAEAPEFIALWSLDARKMERYNREEESWKGTRQVAGKVAKIAKFLKKQETAPSRGALFFGLAQNCFDLRAELIRPYYMRTALEHFLYAGVKLDLLCTEEVIQGALTRYDVVFINGHQWITQGVKEALEAYITGGGAVVVDSETTIDIAGATKADGPFATGLGDLGDPDRVERCRKYADQYVSHTLVQAVSPNTVIRMNHVENVPLAWVIDVESAEDSQALRAAQSNNWKTGVYELLNRKAAETPVVKKKVTVDSGWHVYNLWAGEQVRTAKDEATGGNRGELNVECFGAVPLALYRDQIESIRITDVSKQVTRGDVFAGHVDLKSRRGTPVRGVVPAQVTVSGPDGTEVWEYGGNALIDNGILAVRFRTAANDPVGTWKIEIRELASSKTAAAEFALD